MTNSAVFERGVAPSSPTISGRSQDARSGGDRRPAPTPLTVVERSWWTAAGVVLVMWALQLFDVVSTFPWMSVIIVVVGLWGLGTVACSWLPQLPYGGNRGVRALAAATTLVIALLAFGAWSYGQVRAAPAYGTDEIAFDQYAATLAVHGENPYTHSMAPSFSKYQVSPDGYTFSLDGRPITSLSYPALAFEVYMPLLALGWSTQLAIAVNVFAWMAAIALLFVLLPRRLKPMALVVGSLSVYVGYAVGGVTDAVFVPLLIGAAVAWNRFGEQRGPRSWVGPGLLGLAMAVKQTPWLILPFVLTGVILERRAAAGTRQGMAAGRRYLTISAICFLAPNLPFMIAAPRQWFGGVLTPIAGHAVPAGQGAVGLSLFLGLGGGSITAYTATAFLLLFTIWVAYTFTYPLLRPWAFFAPSIVLFFSARSFGSYLVTLVPAALVAAVTLDRSRDGLFPPRPAIWKAAVAACGVATGTAFAIAVLSAPPLSVKVLTIRTTGQLATVEQVTVMVKNQSGGAVTPAFTINQGGSVTTFWLASGGPPTLQPDHSATYVLSAPNFDAMPPLGAGFQVDAFTSSPATVATSAAYLPSTWHLALDPDAINVPVAVGQQITVRAQLLDQLDRPVHSGGVPVYLGQIIYDQQGLEYAEATINAGQTGQTPVMALTDPDGVATFVIQGHQTSIDPVYFEANLVSSKHFYPYGYSGILPIRFVAP